MLLMPLFDETIFLETQKETVVFYIFSYDLGSLWLRICMDNTIQPLNRIFLTMTNVLAPMPENKSYANCTVLGEAYFL